MHRWLVEVRSGHSVVHNLQQLDEIRRLDIELGEVQMRRGLDKFDFLRKG